MISNYKYKNAAGDATELSWVLLERKFLIDGGLHTSGQGSFGVNAQLGSVANISSPVQIGSLTTWLSSSAGERFNAALLETNYSGIPGAGGGFGQAGQLWAWGRNNNGQLGLGDIINRSSPVQVGSGNWSVVSCGNAHMLFIENNGTLWGCGSNSVGQLGLGDTTSLSSPVQIGSLSDWRSISCGTNYSIAIKNNGTLWGWGSNSVGQLGLGNTTSLSSPVQIGSLSDWRSISCGADHSLAIKTNNTLWGWGGNDGASTGPGKLGTGDAVNRSSPTQIGALTNWGSVDAGFNFSASIKTDNTLWTWGLNDQGQLGNGIINLHKSSPTQVGTLSDWGQVSAGGYFMHAIKTTGSLWGCGFNTSGQLGTGDVISRSSPVQIGALTNWSQVSCGYENVSLIKMNAYVV